MCGVSTANGHVLNKLNSVNVTPERKIIWIICSVTPKTGLFTSKLHISNEFKRCDGCIIDFMLNSAIIDQTCIIHQQLFQLKGAFVTELRTGFNPSIFIKTPIFIL